MKYFDIYEDTLKVLAENGGKLWENNGAIDLLRTAKYEHYGQFFALWTDFAAFADDDARSEAFYTLYRQALQLVQEVEDKAALCRTSGDMQRAFEGGKSALFLSSEDVASMGRYAYEAFALGFRVMCIMGVHETQFGHSTAGENKGLKPAGKQLVQQYDAEGLVIDVAHMAEAGFYDVCELVQRPIIASHANARGVYNHHRNLTDGQLRALIQKKGLIGLIPFRTFMTDDEKFTPAHVVAHAEHILALGGEDILAFGGDLDGIDGLFPEGFTGIESMDYLYEAFARHNYSEALLDKIFFGNAHRFVLDNL